MVIYSLGAHSVLGSGVSLAGRSRSLVELGQDFDTPIDVDTRLERLSSVLGYLSDRSITAKQIWADSGKKIVVRTARGS